MLLMLVDRPFIIKLEMTFMDSENLYFVFEHCQYGTLSNLIKQSGKLQPEVAVFFAAEIVMALEQCFNLQIMHRDIKPENILIDTRCHLKLIDFGDAKQFDDDVYDFSFEYRQPQTEESKTNNDNTVNDGGDTGVSHEWQIIDSAGYVTGGNEPAS